MHAFTRSNNNKNHINSITCHSLTVSNTCWNTWKHPYLCHPCDNMYSVNIHFFLTSLSVEPFPQALIPWFLGWSQDSTQVITKSSRPSIKTFPLFSISRINDENLILLATRMNALFWVTKGSRLLPASGHWRYPQSYVTQKNNWELTTQYHRIARSGLFKPNKIIITKNWI